MLPDPRAARSFLLSWREQERFVRTLDGFHLVNNMRAADTPRAKGLWLEQAAALQQQG